MLEMTVSYSRHKTGQVGGLALKLHSRDSQPQQKEPTGGSQGKACCKTRKQHIHFCLYLELVTGPASLQGGGNVGVPGCSASNKYVHNRQGWHLFSTYYMLSLLSALEIHWVSVFLETQFK